MAALSAPDAAIATAIAEARQDFEARYDELGLVGAAPLAGADAASDAAAATARADRARAARRAHESAKREHRSDDRSN